ncbi:hypothetical protein PTKIN_Ptkin16aG0038500 [Pterospermum kingtungense]
MAFIGEAAVFAFLEALFGKFTSSEFKFVTEKWVRKEIMNWETTLRNIHALLADAEGKQLQNKSVKLWLTDLQDLAYDVDDILDEFSTEALGRMLMKKHQASTSMAQKLKPSFFSGLDPSSVMFNYNMISKIREITGKLEDLAKRKSELQLMENTTNDAGRSKTVPRRSESTSGVNEANIRGKDKDKRAILDLLLRNDGADAGVYSVIPIVGMGGIGKRTLAQLVYNDDSIKDHFDLRLWVYVSDNFDIKWTITKTILQGITSASCDMNDLNSLQDKLKQNLSKKKFLLVLDDVWNENYSAWLALRPPFDAGEAGSKIMVTTRSSSVSSIMRTVPADYSLECLSGEDSLRMLAHHALGREDFTRHPDLKEIGMEIVKKCGGLPLATTTIGGLLRTKENGDAWKDILESNIWDLPPEKSDIVPALWLSYYYLPSHLKQCLAYCSLLPKDYEFNEEEIIFLWMAEGFLQTANTKRRIEDLGSKYFQELVSRSFFQASSRRKSQFVMHDLINDLAQFVGGEKFFRMERREVMKRPTQTRHSSYIMDDYEEMKKFETFYQAKSLRTFLPIQSQMMTYPWCFLSNNVLNDLLSRLKCLRVLSLKGYRITEIPDSIGNLRHLRSLNFSYTWIKGLPDSICTLYNLETLLLRSCEKIEKLPPKIGILENLCHLDIAGAKLIKEMPSGICNLTNLRALSNFIVGQGEALNIREMQNLSYLKGQLSISELQNVNEAQHAWEAKVSSKPDLDDLELKWSEVFDEDLRKKEVETEVLKLLQPHQQLKALAIMYYAGIVFPSWIEDPSFKNMQSLKLEGCPNCKLLPAVGKLPLLKDLYIKGMSSITSVGKELYGENLANAFPSLEKLQFDDMAEWREWKACEFDCLRELLIENCPKLIGTLPKYLTSLEKLVLRKCQDLIVSISNLPMPCELEIDGCKEVVVGSCIDLWLVKKVNLSNISKFGCEMMMMSKSMKVEHLSLNGWEELDSFWWSCLVPLGSLRNLNIQHCPEVVSIGARKEEEKAELQQLDIPCNIENLSIEDCEGLENLSKTLHSNPTCLREICIAKCPKLVSLLADSLPSTLKSLKIEECENLVCLLEDGENISFSTTSLLESIYVNDCKTERYECKALKSLSSSGKLPTRLKTLHTSNCPVLELVAKEIGDNTCLDSIEIWNCENIQYLPKGMDKLGRLQSIAIGRCGNLVCFPESGLPTNLTELQISDCEKLEALPKLYSLLQLQDLFIMNCPRVTSIPEGGLPTNIQRLYIYEPYLCKVVMERELHRLTSLKALCIDGRKCIQVVSFPQGMNIKQLPPSLEHISIFHFKNVRKLSSKGFQHLSSLQSLYIFDCPKLKSLPEKEMLPSLLELKIRECPELKKRCKRDKGNCWPNISHVPHVEIADKLIYE